MDLDFAIALWPLAALLSLLALQKAWRCYSTLRVLRDGTQGTAEIVRSRLRRYDTIVEFKFEVNGRSFVQKRYLEGVCADLRPGERLALKYLDGNPLNCVLVEYEGKHDAR